MNMIYLQCKTKIIPTDKEVSARAKAERNDLYGKKR